MIQNPTFIEKFRLGICGSFITAVLLKTMKSMAKTPSPFHGHQGRLLVKEL